MLGACADMWNTATPSRIAELCKTSELLALRSREAAAGRAKPITTEGNVVALSGVDLEAARRARRRSRRKA